MANQPNPVQEVFREHFTPEAVAMIVAYLQVASITPPENDAAMRAMDEVEWLAESLSDLLGPRLNELSERLGL